jgi:hypothetical protein
MFRQGVRTFDLYDFFSVFIPGLSFLIAILPILPSTVPVDFGISGLVILLIFGVAFGRGVHAVGVEAESKSSVRSHREKFKYELKNQDELSSDLVNKFINTSQNRFGEEYGDPLDEQTVDDLYVLARSLIHMSSKGRSRTFQAVLDFYRSMLIVCISSITLYLMYTLYTLFGGGYKSYLDVALASNGMCLNTGSDCTAIHPSLIFVSAGVVFSFSYWMFRRIRNRYRRFYLQYLLADFIILQQTMDNSDPNKSADGDGTEYYHFT